MDARAALARWHDVVDRRDPGGLPALVAPLGICMVFALASLVMPDLWGLPVFLFLFGLAFGALRGVVHAGYGGHEGAIVWARPIASAQIRIGDAVARAPEGSSLSNMRKLDGHEVAEQARLQGGVIVIDAHR